MSHLDPKQRATRSELRSFGLLVGGAFVLLAAVILWRRGLTPFAQAFGGIGGALAIAGVLFPDALGPVHAGWMRLAVGLSKVTTPIFMSVVYFGILTPMSLLGRLAGRRPLRPHRSDSYWVTRAEGSRRGDLQRQF